MPATTPLQRYQIMESLGHGRQGRTFRAVDRDTGREVAVKVMSLRELEGWKGFDRFEREVAVLKSLHHRGIPRFVDSYASETTGDYFLVMELIEGASLHARMANGWRPRPEALASIFAQALAVLEYLHGQSPPIIHRDIKPANLMWTADERLVLVDFGGARQARRDEPTTMIGSYGYMAPEQLHGEVTPAVDIYALGATMAALASGRESEDLPREGLRVRIEALDVPSWLATVLPRMLEPDPNRRLRTIAAVRELAATVRSPPRSQGQRPSAGARDLPVAKPSAALDRVPGPLSLLVWMFAGLGAGLLLVFEVAIVPLIARLSEATRDKGSRSGRESDELIKLRDSVRRGRAFLHAVAEENRPRTDSSSDG